MKRRTFINPIGAIVIILGCMVAENTTAFDGEVYIGKAFDSTFRSAPDGGAMEYTAGIEVGQDIGPVRFYTSSETFCDKYVEDRGFHPDSIKWTAGAEYTVGDVFVNAEHMCWHPVDDDGGVEQYTMVKVGFRFKSQ